MLDKNKVLSFVKEKGPVLPRDISKQFGGDTFITGAVLSTMVDAKEIKISSAKIGGSPVYYFSGQEEKLSILFQYLPGKEKEAYTLLKDMKIIKDSTAEPAIRVAFRNIKDFAKPIEVNLGESKEIFWKWHLFPNQDAERAIREFFLPKQDNKAEVKTTETITIQRQPEIQKDSTAVQEKPKEKPTEKIEKEETLAEQKTEQKTEQKKLIPEVKQETREDKPKKAEDTDFLIKIKKIFQEKNIEILETQIIRKNTELEMIIDIPSPAGKLRYFCKIRDKKKTNDKDMSSLFVQTQMKKLPALYVTTGEITKKAREMLESEFKTISTMHI